jgi:hypothetical protein
MSTRSILFSLLLFILPINAMKRSHDQMVKTDNPNNCMFVITDIENIITNHITHYPLARKPREATEPINILAQTNKQFYAIINNPKFSDNLIKMLGQKLYCSHETIARMLWTEESHKRLNLQYKLKKLCCTKYELQATKKEKSIVLERLNRLITDNIDLEFTHNHFDVQKTPLMISASNDNNPMFEILLEKNANINSCNSHGISTLKLLMDVPIKFYPFKQLIKYPTLNINQQNRHGETALLRCLLLRKKRRIAPIFVSSIKELLDAGADPELADNYGITPLMAAQQLQDKAESNNERIIDLIKQAIERKYSTS